MGNGASQIAPRLQARIAGWFYLIIIVAGAFGYTAGAGLIDWNDAAATANNISGSKQLWRMGLGAMLVMLASDVVVAAIFYVLFRPVNMTLSLVAFGFRIVLVGIVSTSILARYLPLLILDYDQVIATIGADQVQLLALQSLRLFDRGFSIALVFFGFHCLALGWLIFRSKFMPTIFGVLLLLAGLCYLIDSAVYLVFPDWALPIDIVVFSYVVESLLCLWLIAMGVDDERWRQQARTAN